MVDLSDYWPKAVAHLGNPLYVDDSEEIIVAEISEAPVNIMATDKRDRRRLMEFTS